jgi:dTDP-4-amino-4,6-dideoxygalactose transaminase
MKIPFNKPHMTGKEHVYITEAYTNGMLAGDGPFTKQCHEWLEKNTGTKKALLTHSCTAALEMAAMLLDIEPGDEVIMPSFTFVSTANAFALRGAVPVFVDIRTDTLNLDEKLIEGAITSKTKAIVPVHYAGVACEMDTIMAIANKHNLAVVEDAAQGVMASYKDRPLGSIGNMGTFSFHETKNIISGEGGALLVNDPKLVSQAEIIREKGTDRSRFFRGAVDKYTWQSIGSSFLPGELIAAFLWAQLEDAKNITEKRLSIWNEYHQMLAPLEEKGVLRRPIIPDDCQQNGHLYYILLNPKMDRQKVLADFKDAQIMAPFHYIPLHSSPAGMQLGRAHGSMEVTDAVSEQLLRLPLWYSISKEEQERVVAVLAKL